MRDIKIADIKKELEYAEILLESLKHNHVMRSIIYIGHKGIAKTFLLNTIQQMADEKNIEYIRLERGDELISSLQLLEINKKCESNSLTDALIASLLLRRHCTEQTSLHFQ